MSKKGMNFTSFTIALLFLVVFAIFFGTYVGGLEGMYNTGNLDTEQGATYAKLSEVANLTAQIGDSVGEGDSTSEDFDAKVYKKGFSSMKLVYFTGPSLIYSMFADFSIKLGLPPWVLGFVMGLIISILAYLALSIFIKAFFKL